MIRRALLLRPKLGGIRLQPSLPKRSKFGVETWQCRAFAGSTTHEGVPKAPLAKQVTPDYDDDDEDDDEEGIYVDMLDESLGEWGGPTKGGTRPEPTRHGDWHHKGRCTDFE